MHANITFYFPNFFDEFVLDLNRRKFWVVVAAESSIRCLPAADDEEVVQLESGSPKRTQQDEMNLRSWKYEPSQEEITASGRYYHIIKLLT